MLPKQSDGLIQSASSWLWTGGIYIEREAYLDWNSKNIAVGGRMKPFIYMLGRDLTYEVKIN
jgi:hypothetical protein